MLMAVDVRAILWHAFCVIERNAFLKGGRCDRHIDTGASIGSREEPVGRGSQHTHHHGVE